MTKALEAVIRVLGAINRATLEVCRVAVIALVAGIAVVVGAGVLWRYGFNNSLSWSEEVSKALMLWMVFTGAPIGLRFNDHVAIEIVPQMLPERGRALLRALIMALVALFLAILAYRGWELTLNGMSQVAVTIGDISMAWIIGAVPAGASLMALVAVQVLLEQLVIAMGGTPPVDTFMRRYHGVLKEVDIA